MIRIINTKWIGKKKISSLIIYPTNTDNLKKEVKLLIKQLINNYTNGVWTSLQIETYEDEPKDYGVQDV